MCCTYQPREWTSGGWWSDSGQHGYLHLQWRVHACWRNAERMSGYWRVEWKWTDLWTWAIDAPLIYSMYYVYTRHLCVITMCARCMLYLSMWDTSIQKLSPSFCESQDWIPISLHLAAIECDPLPDPKYGSVDVPDTILGSVATYRCDKGFQLIGSNIRICEIDGWSGEEPICRR